jgi:hypothetical protein
MLDPNVIIPAAQKNLVQLTKKWAMKKLYNIGDETTPTFDYINSYLRAIQALTCSTLSVQDQQCLLLYISPPNC